MTKAQELIADLQALGWKEEPAIIQKLVDAIKHYEAALKEAFPSGATGEAWYEWNEARKVLELK